MIIFGRGEAVASVGSVRLPLPVLREEWSRIVDAWQITGWEEYRVDPRLGRKMRYSPAQQQSIWAALSAVRDDMHRQQFWTEAGQIAHVVARLAQLQTSPYDFVLADEAQNLGVPQL